MNPPKLLLDVSDIVVWIKHGHEHYSGIQRVVVNTCVELAKTDRAHLFYMNPENGRLFDFDCGDFERFKMCKLESTWLTSNELKTKPRDWLLFMGASWSVGGHLENLQAYCKSHQLLFAHFVYDVSPLSVPQTHTDEMVLVTKDWFSKVVQFTDLLFTISDFSKTEASKWANELLQKKIEIFPVRIGDEILSREESPIDSLANKKFILNVGTLEARKNQVVLYQAYKILLRKYSREQLPLLVFVGYEGWFSADVRRALFEDPELKGLIVWLKAVTDPQLAWLYSNCQFSVFSSVYEGWGLPVAESLSRGKACICSRIDVFKEISKDLLIFADPYSGAEWAREIEALFSKPQLLEEREKKIAENFRTTRWRDTADQVVEIFERYVNAAD